jgi:uncharacterized membrane protein (UPF0127 family)
VPAKAEPRRSRSAPTAIAAATLALALLLASACGGGGSSDATPTPSPLPLTRATITLRTRANHDIPLNVEITDTPDEYRRGLMFRRELAENAGMIFVFRSHTEAGFWMKDTYIALSIAFIDVAGKIIDIQDMKPLDETLHNPPGPYYYALEVNQGWFERNGLAVGDKMLGPLLTPEPTATP